MAVLALNLKLLRFIRGFKQGDLAKLLRPPVSQVLVSDWERAGYSPSIDQLGQLASIFGLTPDDLLSELACTSTGEVFRADRRPRAHSRASRTAGS